MWIIIKYKKNELSLLTTELKKRSEMIAKYIYQSFVFKNLEKKN